MDKHEAEKAERHKSDALDLILGRTFAVLDDGFVRVIDYMGNDDAIVQAARISYGKGTKRVSEDRGLIRYLMRHRHTTPFEMCEIKLHVRVPMDCWRQWIRHRTANVNEYSTRYSEAIEATQKTNTGEWRLQSQANRQGSTGFAPASVGEVLTARETELHELARAVYLERLQHDVAREQARKDLPLSTYTEAYWKVDLHNLLHFLSLRMDAHAQLEIRQFAEVIGNEIVSKWCPLVWEAFRDFRLTSASFSGIEFEILRAVLGNNANDAVRIAEDAGWLDRRDEGLIKSRERQECEQKFDRLGVQCPWEKG
jgi:thymidylate synthase (FAD)